MAGVKLCHHLVNLAAMAAYMRDDMIQSADIASVLQLPVFLARYSQRPHSLCLYAGSCQ